MQKEVLSSQKQQDHAYEQQNPFRLKEDNPSEQLPEPIESSNFVSNRACMSGDFDSRKDSHSTKFEQRSRIFVSFRELCDSKLSALHPFDMAIIH